MSLYKTWDIITHDISTNLLYVHRFTNDNNFYFIFDSSSFCIKNKATRNLLFRRQSENSLYPFPIHKVSPNSHIAQPTAYVGEWAFASIWNSRLGHPTSFTFHLIVFSFHLPINCSSKLSSICNECQMCKSKKLPLFYFRFYFFTSIGANTLWSLGFISRAVNKWLWLLYFFSWWLHKVCIVLPSNYKGTNICNLS